MDEFAAGTGIPGGPQAEGWAMVRFGCGPYCCLLDARQVASMMAAAVAERVPIERFLGLDPPRGGARRCLALHTPEGPVAVEVAEPVALVRVAPGSLHPLPPLLAAACRLPAVRALQCDGARWSLVLSARYLGIS